MHPHPAVRGAVQLARNAASVMQAGARTVPDDSVDVEARPSDRRPLGVWHAEGAADITDGGVRSTADPDGEDAGHEVLAEPRAVRRRRPHLDDAIRNAISQALALEIDRVGLYGDNVTTPEEPDGIRYTTGSGHEFSGATAGRRRRYDFLSTRCTT